jgi:hypothetical protein
VVQIPSVNFLFFPCFSLIKLEKYKIGKWSQLLNKVNSKNIKIKNKKKLTEMWKALNDSQYPLREEQKSEKEDGIGTRSMTRGDLIEFGSSTNSKKSFMGSSTQLWNVAPEEIKKALSFTSAKKIIKAYCKTLPI